MCLGNVAKSKGNGTFNMSLQATVHPPAAPSVLSDRNSVRWRMDSLSISQHTPARRIKTCSACVAAAHPFDAVLQPYA
jgi:hypothetical protein